jgi:hypothetical protein
MTTTNKVNKIFQIGFNKCGTKSMYQFFSYHTKPAVKSLHYEAGKLAKKIYLNNKKGLPLLTGYEDYKFFSDMEFVSEDQCIFISETLFKKLDKQYPNSKFILNTRTMENWVKSRINHSNGKYTRYQLKHYELSLPKLVKKWESDWIKHHKAVLEYFKDRPNDLLVFDIEKDSGMKLVKFLRGSINFIPYKLPHAHKTKSRREILLKKLKKSKK